MPTTPSLSASRLVPTRAATLVMFQRAHPPIQSRSSLACRALSCSRNSLPTATQYCCSLHVKRSTPPLQHSAAPCLVSSSSLLPNTGTGSTNSPDRLRCSQQLHPHIDCTAAHWPSHGLTRWPTYFWQSARCDGIVQWCHHITGSFECLARVAGTTSRSPLLDKPLTIMPSSHFLSSGQSVFLPAQHFHCRCMLKGRRPTRDSWTLHRSSVIAARDSTQATSRFTCTNKFNTSNSAPSLHTFNIGLACRCISPPFI